MFSFIKKRPQQPAKRSRPKNLAELVDRMSRDIEARADLWLATTCHNEDGEMVAYAIPFKTELEALNYLDKEAKRITGFGSDRINLAGRYDFTDEPGVFYGQILPLNVTDDL
jgi:hypothetical protein